jgi:hypothetical protein
MVLAIYALAGVATVLAVVSVGAYRWGRARRLVTVSAWLSTITVSTLFVLGYGKAQAAYLPARWEPRALPADWPAGVFVWLCSGWIVASLVWAIAVSRAHPRPAPPPAPSAPPWRSTYVPPYETRRPRVRYRVVTERRK